MTQLKKRFSLLASFLLIPLWGCSSKTENPPASTQASASVASASEVSTSVATMDQAALEASLAAATQASQAAQVEAEMAQIASAPAETIVSTELMSPEQVRAEFYSQPVSAELLAQIDNDFYSSQQSFLDPADLRLVRLLYVDFDGQTRVGEMIVHENIADDIEDIFYELYRNAYPIQRVVLPIGYNADDNAIMTDGITRALGFTWDENGQPMEHEHSLGLAVDFNSLYNPQVIVEEDGSITVLPPAGQPYADRTNLQPHMLSENDLAVQLFLQHGFTWGGYWEGRNDYQHFEKNFNHDTGHFDPTMSA